MLYACLWGFCHLTVCWQWERARETKDTAMRDAEFNCECMIEKQILPKIDRFRIWVLNFDSRRIFFSFPDNSVQNFHFYLFFWSIWDVFWQLMWNETKRKHNIAKFTDDFAAWNDDYRHNLISFNAERWHIPRSRLELDQRSLICSSTIRAWVSVAFNGTHISDGMNERMDGWMDGSFKDGRRFVNHQNSW